MERRKKSEKRENKEKNMEEKTRSDKLDQELDTRSVRLSFLNRQHKKLVTNQS